MFHVAAQVFHFNVRNHIYPSGATPLSDTTFWTEWHKFVFYFSFTVASIIAMFIYEGGSAATAVNEMTFKQVLMAGPTHFFIIYGTYFVLCIIWSRNVVYPPIIYFWKGSLIVWIDGSV